VFPISILDLVKFLKYNQGKIIVYKQQAMKRNSSSEPLSESRRLVQAGIRQE
jgi:hypothetical protein